MLADYDDNGDEGQVEKRRGVFAVQLRLCH